MGDLMQQVIVVVWPGLGVGAVEAARGKSRAELQRVATYVGGLDAPTLQWLGLGNVAPIRGVPPADPPAASHGRIAAPGLDALLGDAASAVLAAGRQVHLVGAAGTALAHAVQGATSHTPGARSALEHAADLAQTGAAALVIAVPSADESPSSASPVTAARSVQRLDGELARLFDRMQGREDVMVLVTSYGGQDTVRDPGSPPEWVPVLAHLGALPSGIALGDRGPGDLGATVAEALGASARSGASFLADLLA